MSAYFHTSPQLVSSAADVDLESILASLNAQTDHFYETGSGFNLAKVTQFVLVVTKFRTFHGYSFISTPKYLHNKKCMVNVQNGGEKFFLWAILSCLHEPATHKERVTKYQQYLDTLNVQGLNFPLSPKQILVFEKLNPEISISLYSLHQDNEKAFNVEYVSPHLHRPHHVNLVLEDDTIKHYAWIRDMSPSCRTDRNTKNVTCVTNVFSPFRPKRLTTTISLAV